MAGSKRDSSTAVFEAGEPSGEFSEDQIVDRDTRVIAFIPRPLGAEARRGAGCCSVGNQLQLGGIAGVQLWHTIRNADGSWQSSFGLVAGAEANGPVPFTAVGCAGAGNQLQLIGTANPGRTVTIPPQFKDRGNGHYIRRFSCAA